MTDATAPADELSILRQKADSAQLPGPVRDRVATQIDRLTRLSGSDYTLEADRTIRWLDWIMSLPWDARAADHLDLKNAKEILDKHHHGLEEVKTRLLEYLSVLKLKQSTTNNQQSTINNQFHAPIQVQLQYPVMLLDELDRVADLARHDIMGVLVELLDPEQNKAFLDHYLDVPFDLSEVFFIATANNTGNVATAVMDRMEPISMPAYTDDDKITIAKNYLLPRAAAEAGLPEGSLVIDPDVWPLVVRPLGYDAGIRTLQRTIQSLVRQTALNLVTGGHQVLHLTIANFKHYMDEW